MENGIKKPISDIKQQTMNELWSEGFRPTGYKKPLFTGDAFKEGLTMTFDTKDGGGVRVIGKKLIMKESPNFGVVAVKARYK